MAGRPNLQKQNWPTDKPEERNSGGETTRRGRGEPKTNYNKDKTPKGGIGRPKRDSRNPPRGEKSPKGGIGRPNRDSRNPPRGRKCNYTPIMVEGTNSVLRCFLIET
jgi:hypothetical protein